MTKSSSRPTRPAVSPAAKKRGPKPRPLVEFPEPLWPCGNEPATFADALAYQMRRHGESCFRLHRNLIRPGETFDRKTFQSWVTGAKQPATVASFNMLSRIERRYRLPDGHLRCKLACSGRATIGHALLDVTPAERRRLAWHLPDDFDARPSRERAEIVQWIRDVIISGTTSYRRYQAEAMKVRYGLRFDRVVPAAIAGVDGITEPGGRGSLLAPAALTGELKTLIAFKTATLADIGLKRSGVWNEATSVQKIEHLGLMFGALAADPAPPVSGRGVARDALAMGLLAFPAVWDWYVQWREKRRGFYTAWEINMLDLCAALTRRETGWLRQNPGLAARLLPVAGLVSEREVERARCDWGGLCDEAYDHALARSKEIARVARVHRDPFEPILPILEADSPVGAYRRITAEIIARLPDARRYPRAAAEAVRGLLMLRLGLHLGVRQKNLRQLLVCRRGTPHRSERQLETLKCGELRWSERDRGWEVLIPSAAFKNAHSSFFGQRPFRLILPDLDGLYGYIEAYIERHRARLLGGAEDPGTFFVKTVTSRSARAAYDQATFYEAWRLMIQRYGIHNPYTGRGAIKGLLPHGPHNVRDVLATHVLKRTGSYEQAGYAIQDTAETVAMHYGRFLPQDKSALAAGILNQAWDSG